MPHDCRYRTLKRVKAALFAPLQAAAVAATIAAASGLLTASVASAEAARPVVVELFTSQGCSSCPPADAYMKELSQRRDLIALSLPVTYWDYLGWKDTLASEAHTVRQRAYAEALGERGPYTPQMIVDGRRGFVGSHKRDVAAAIEESQSRAAEMAVPISLTVDGDALIIRVGASETDGDAYGTVWLAAYCSEKTVEILRGENSGREITYHNVVRELSPVGMWTGEPLEIAIPSGALVGDDIDGAAVILQQDKQGAVLGAAKLTAPLR